MWFLPAFLRQLSASSCSDVATSRYVDVATSRYVVEGSTMPTAFVHL
jgi:hypothetical protein